MNNRLLRPPLLEWAILPPRPYGLYDAGNGVPIPEAAGVELGPPVLLEGEDLVHYERLLAQVTAEPWRWAISTRVSGRDRHERIPVILKTETSVLRAAALGRLEFDHDFTAPWRLLRGEDH